MSEPGQENSSNMSSRKLFELLGSATTDGLAPRLGRLSFPGRRTIETPNFIAVTSRGAVPHITPDNLRKHVPVGAVYMGLEDFIEKKDPPMFQTPKENGRRLHSFTALPSEFMTILGPRRCPAVTTPVGNAPNSMAVFTSTGFRNVTVPEFAAAVESLQPDIILPMADLPHTSTTPVSKKLIRMVERTEVWLDEFFKKLSPHGRLDDLGVSVFAPVLPVEYPIQWDYLRHLSEDVLENLTGLAIYDANLLPDLTNYPPLAPLPKLSMDPPKSPHEVLRQISLGVDICTIPFVNSISDAGVALTFSFPPPAAKELLPLGVNMWSTEHSVAVTPLVEGCQCYTCSKHHRAYLLHLLNAKEMLGWNLLQIHNHHVVSEFFKGIRETLNKGLAEFEQARQQFLETYEPELPGGTGARPRARGYHFKSEASQEKINKPAWVDLGKDEVSTEPSSAANSTPNGDGQEATPVTPLGTEAVAADSEITQLEQLQDK